MSAAAAARAPLIRLRLRAASEEEREWVGEGGAGEEDACTGVVRLLDAGDGLRGAGDTLGDGASILLLLADPVGEGVAEGVWEGEWSAPPTLGRTTMGPAAAGRGEEEAPIAA